MPLKHLAVGKTDKSHSNQALINSSKNHSRHSLLTENDGALNVLIFLPVTLEILSIDLFRSSLKSIDSFYILNYGDLNMNQPHDLSCK